MRGNLLRAAAFLIASTCGISAYAEKACNNSPLLCDRPWNNITYLGAHDSPFVRNASNNYDISGDQYYNSVIQLEAGVRLLTGQVHSFDTPTGTEWHLCHTSCFLYDAGPLSDWLSSLKRWLDKNPNEVISILLVNSDDATAHDLDPQFKTANIVKYAYVPSDTTRPKTHWPTLNELISMDKRLMVFIASLNPKNNTRAPYMLNEFTFMFENNYNVLSEKNFSCTANRPPRYDNRTQAALASGRFPLMNHFLYHELLPGVDVPSPRKDEHRTNRPSGGPGNLGDTADHCTKVYGAPPVFILVDFFNDGPAIATIDRLNGVTHPVGRRHIAQGKPK